MSNSGTSLEDQIRHTRERLRIVEGLVRAMRDPLAIVQVVAEANDDDAAHQGLQERFDLDLLQAQVVLSTRFSSSTELGRRGIEDECRELTNHMADLKVMASA